MFRKFERKFKLCPIAKTSNKLYLFDKNVLSDFKKGQRASSFRHALSDL